MACRRTFLPDQLAPFGLIYILLFELPAYRKLYHAERELYKPGLGAVELFLPLFLKKQTIHFTAFCFGKLGPDDYLFGHSKFR